MKVRLIIEYRREYKMSNGKMMRFTSCGFMVTIRKKDF